MKIKLPTLVLAALLFAGLPLASSNAYIAVSVAIAPPAIPVYTQPYAPGPGYLWTPGYWAWDGYGYYWARGVWVLAPRVGYLWTPGYWGYSNGLYVFNDGYWGPTVGFYGGINYGFGYGGRGYYGGRWSGNTFLYNTAVTRVNTNVITTTYVNREVVNNTGSRAGFNGPGGAQAKPNSRELAAAKGPRVAPTREQRSVVKSAKKDPALHAKNNKGKPSAEAVNQFRGKNRQQTAGAEQKNRGENASRSGANASPTGTEKRARTEKATGRAAKATEPKRNLEARKVKTAPRPERHVQSAPRKPQAVRAPREVKRAPQQVRRAPQPMRNRQAAPAPRGARGPAAQAPDEGGKKKKPNG